MQGLKVFPPSAACQQALLFLQGRQETKLCDHFLATLVHSLTGMQSSDQWFHTVFSGFETSEYFLSPSLGEGHSRGRETEGAEGESATGSGKSLGGKQKPWSAGSYSTTHGNPSPFWPLCSTREPPEGLSVGGKASSNPRFSAATPVVVSELGPITSAQVAFHIDCSNTTGCNVKDFHTY